MIVVDSNVIIDIIQHDDRWFDWSLGQIERATSEGRVVMSAISIGEAAPRFGSLPVFIDEMAVLMIAVEPLTAEAAYLGGRAFVAYRSRRAQGVSKSLLADFLIGGHAASIDATILTRDPRFYRTYFPDLTLITPESHP